MTTLSAPSFVCKESRSSSRARIDALAWTLLVTVCIASALLSRLSYLTKPFDPDGAMFVYLGKLVCDGGRFGHDLLDNKFPSVGLMTSIFWRMFGAWWPGYVLAQTAMALGGALMLARAAARTFGEPTRLPTALFALVYLNFNVSVFGGFQLETMQMFFAILSAAAALEALRRRDARDAFVAGLAAGCAAMLKPTGASVLAAFAVGAVIAWSRREKLQLLKHGGAAACGFAIPLLVVLLYLIRTDTLGDLLGIYHQISRYASETPLEGWAWMKPVVVCAIVGFPILVRGFIFRRDREGFREKASGDAILVFLIAWFALELTGAVMQRRMYAYHFLTLAAPASLMFGMFPRRLRVAPLVAALLPLIVLSAISSRTVIEECSKEPRRLAVSDYLTAHARPNDLVWQDLTPRLLIETNLRPGSRIPLTFLFLNYDDAPLDYVAVMLHDFDVRRPRWVVLPNELSAKLKYECARAPEMFDRPVRAKNYVAAWEQINDYVSRHYRVDAAVGRETVYHRND